MDKNTKKMLIVGGVVAAGAAFWYFFFGPGAAVASTTTTTTTTSDVSEPLSTPTSVTPGGGYNAADEANIAIIDAWINSMTPNSAQQNYWLGVIQANPSPAVLQMWVQCMQVFGTKGASLTASQQAFWNNLAQGH
jgi:hypothetical protein